MKLFLDSTNIEAIKLYSSYHILDGVTTNPSLFSKENGDFYELVTNISSVVEGDVSVEVLAGDYDDIVIEGRKIVSIAPNIVIKLPITWDGIKACYYFNNMGYKVNMTLCFSANQALLAAKAGAYYVSPFIGRLRDNMQDPMILLQQIRKIFDYCNYSTKILAASIRSVDDVYQTACCKADVATLPEKIFADMIKHDLTDVGLKKFNSDWQKSHMKI
ncbi:transaldolase family protein [Rickettsia endosymbiont of Cardiosporidium cionae]|uniref:transaldolase family protein n=1 Tax=Rickettsia endosymbiont of Cardiosporidium cionae TaxID=2777155 RepID=UPI0018961385|nr:transaldolase family protein [Rickettsia endosymbiont of Cardiosporidium cionae]KAF8818284.1 fructose-6-phosphate aldolase [Rickettsia endosymbiont of Cardiosporidium cionae]